MSLLARRHDVVAIRWSTRESELPAAGMVYVEDAETGEQIFVDTNDPVFRARLAAAARERQDDLVAAARRRGPRSTRSRRMTTWSGRWPGSPSCAGGGQMTFEWPVLLLSLLAVPILVVAYRAQLRRRDGRRAQLAAEGMVATAAAVRDRGVTSRPSCCSPP